MKKYLFIAIILVFYGCVDSTKEEELLINMVEDCKGKTTIEYTKNPLYNTVKIICVIKNGTK